MQRIQVGDISVLKLSGPLGFEISEKIKDTLIEWIKTGVRKIIVDLTEVELITSGTLGILYAAHQDLKKLGGKLVAVGLKPHVLATLRDWRLDRFIQIFDTLEDARIALTLE